MGIQEFQANLTMLTKTALTEGEMSFGDVVAALEITKFDVLLALKAEQERARKEGPRILRPGE